MFWNLTDKIKNYILSTFCFKLIIYCIGLLGKSLIYFKVKGNFLGIAKSLIMFESFVNWIDNLISNSIFF